MAIVIYARKSVERENSISCETQVEYCKAMIRPEESKEKIFTFVDNGYTGSNTDRQGFQKMMNEIEKGNISKLIVYRLDRISRSLSDFVRILDILKQHKVSFLSTQESFDSSTPYGEMIIKILMVFAEFERQSTIQRVTQAYEYRSELGIYMGGRRPYGFTFIPTEIHGIQTKMLSPDDTEIEHVKYIYENYAVSGVSLRRLMDNLVENRILPKEGSWSTSKISAIISNPIYVKADNAIYEYYARNNANIISNISEFNGINGIQLYGKTKHKTDDMSDLKVIVMKHEGAIDSDLWLRCQRKLAKNRQISNSNSNSTSWLGGKIACKSCGRTMTVTKGGKRIDGSQTRYFSCTGKSHNRICKGVDVPIYADDLEDTVFKLIEEKLSTLKTERRQITSSNANKTNILKNRLGEISIEQDKLVELMMRQSVDDDMLALLNGKAKKLSDEKCDLVNKIEVLESEECEIVKVANLSAKWKKSNFEERKAVCNVLIDKIYISRDGSIEIVWNI